MRRYEITVRGYEPEEFVAASAAGAKGKAWRALRDFSGCATFAWFLKNVSVKALGRVTQ